MCILDGFTFNIEIGSINYIKNVITSEDLIGLTMFYEIPDGIHDIIIYDCIADSLN